MFVQINRINEENEVKELVVNLDEIAFLSEAKPHEDFVTEERELEDGTTVEVAKIVGESPRYVLGFKNGRHPQFLDQENYQKLKDMLLK